VTSLAYQGWTQGLGIQKVREMNQHAVQDCLPELVLFFDLPVAIGYARTFDASGDKWEQKPISFFEQIHEGFELLFHFDPIKDHIRRVDVSGTLEEAFERTKKTVDTVFEKNR
jgi:dTMP kinase